MLILEDTRQQAGKHRNINRYFDTAGIRWARQALYVGDYVIANDGTAADLRKEAERFVNWLKEKEHG